MIQLGQICLVLSLATAGYAVAASLLGAHRTNPGLIQSGRNAVYATTALVLTGPLFLLNVLLSLIFSRMTGGYAVYGYQSGWFSALITGLVVGAIGFAIVVLVFNFLAKSPFLRE